MEPADEQRIGVVLVALKLGKLVKRNLSDVRVVYTRSDDRFIELDRRGKIAKLGPYNYLMTFVKLHPQV